MYDLGEINREEFREAMKVHAESIIEEMVEAKENSLAAWMEMLRNRRVASRLRRQHGEKLVREVFVALAEVPGFALANWLWNADREDLPLYCFLRSRNEPLFKVLKLVSAPFVLTVDVEYGGAERGASTKERFTMDRNPYGGLKVTERKKL